MSKYTRLGGALLAGVIALVLVALPATAPAQTTQGASAGSTATGGMFYSSTDAATTIRVSLSNATFTIDDEVPIQATQGCSPVAGDATKVTCIAFKESLIKFKRFTVVARGGNDRVENNTTKTNGVGAPMLARGGIGSDTLVGADKVADELNGDSDQDKLIAGNDTPGNDRDHLSGGAGADTLTGGNSRDELFGNGDNDTLDGGDDGVGFFGDDKVSYNSFSDPVVVDLNRETSQGVAGEDTIRRVEDIEGSPLGDTLIGNGDPNVLDGLAGDDTIRGNNGVDVLFGGDGADVLVPSPTSSFPVPVVLSDGKLDIMDCGNLGEADPTAGDLAFRVLADGDSVNDCPVVIDN
jgi:hypothetical protein